MKRLLFGGMILLLLSSCDPEGRKKCEWVIEAEPSDIGREQAGFIPVCARNRRTMKQDCRLQATLQFAKDAYERKFRYIDMSIKSPGNPRTITEIKFCE